MDIDEELKMEVIRQIKADRKISNSDRIKVDVAERIVTLGGYVGHYMDQIEAVSAVECVPGVEGVVQEIEVELPEAAKRNDEEIARSACTAIEHNSTIPPNRVKVTVGDGWVTLDGELDEQHQKDEAEETVAKVLGVRGITNNIVTKCPVRPYDITLQIERNFRHLATHHARDIHVEVRDGKVILSGIVRAWIEKSEAQEAAYEVPGVEEVENQLEMSPLLEGKETPPVKA